MHNDNLATMTSLDKYVHDALKNNQLFAHPLTWDGSCENLVVRHPCQLHKDILKQQIDKVITENQTQA